MNFLRTLWCRLRGKHREKIYREDRGYWMGCDNCKLSYWLMRFDEL